MKNYFLIIRLCILFTVFSGSDLLAQNVKVFILAGQSNMEGQGQISPSDVNGTLSHFMGNNPSDEFNYIQNPDGTWATRSDVWVRYDHALGNLLTGNLTTGYGEWEDAIGPELGFGHLLGDYYQEQVLIIKTCWGGKSLAVDFRPPSSGGTVGPYYNQMLTDISSAIDNIASEFPQYTGGEIEIAGFCWFQGWNDGETEAYLNEYEQNLKNLISDVRTALSSPDLPFVIGLAGNGGFELMENDAWVLGLQTQLVPAQISAAEFPGFTNVAYAETRGFWRDGALSPEPDFVHHWYNNAESYLRIGHELGLEMIKILDGMSTSNNQVLSIQSIRLFPNPIKDYVQIEGADTNYGIQIWDIAGKPLISFSNVSTMEQVDLSNLNSGIYFIEVLNLKGERIALKKLVKQ